MKTSSVRTRTLTVVMAAALIVAVMGASAVAAPSSSSARSHPCVVAAGSGDQAFVSNFNPFNLGAQRDFTWGGIYENLLISTAVGGGRQYNILAKKLRLVEERQDAHDHGAAEREVVRRQAADRGGRPLQPHDRQAGQGRRPDQPRRARQQHRRGQARRQGQGRDPVQAGRLDVPRRAAPERPDRPPP